MQYMQKILLPLAAVAFMAGSAHAQGGGPGGGGGGSFMANLPPAARAKMDAWRKFNENHKNYRQLGQTMRAIGEMDKDPKTKVTKDQAKKIMAAVQPWSSKPTMTDDQALAVNKKITAALNLTQIKKMATLAQQQPRWGGGGGGGRPGGGGGFGGPGGGGPPGGGGGFGGGRPGGGGPGGGGAGGGRGGFDPASMPDPKEYNPLNPATYPSGRMGERQKQRFTEFMTMLKTRAA